MLTKIYIATQLFIVICGRWNYKWAQKCSENIPRHWVNVSIGLCFRNCIETACVYICACARVCVLCAGASDSLSAYDAFSVWICGCLWCCICLFFRCICIRLCLYLSLSVYICLGVCISLCRTISIPPVFNRRTGMMIHKHILCNTKLVKVQCLNDK